MYHVLSWGVLQVMTEMHFRTELWLEEKEKTGPGWGEQYHDSSPYWVYLTFSIYLCTAVITADLSYYLIHIAVNIILIELAMVMVMAMAMSQGQIESDGPVPSHNRGNGCEFSRARLQLHNSCLSGKHTTASVGWSWHHVLRKLFSWEPIGLYTNLP